MPYSEQQLQNARVYAARIDRQLAAEALTADYYASHITAADRESIKARHLESAEAVERGEHDGNFTVAQRMRYYLAGECVPFLPPPVEDESEAFDVEADHFGTPDPHQ